MESRPNSSPKAKTVTDKASSSDDRKDGFLVSCWGRLKTMKLIPWTKRRSSSRTAAARRGVVGNGTAPPASHHRHPVKQIVTSCDCKSIAESLSVIQPRPVAAGGFKYDALSYAQNFDEGSWQDYDIEAFQRGFSSRYAAPNLARPHPHPPTERSLIDE